MLSGIGTQVVLPECGPITPNRSHTQSFIPHAIIVDVVAKLTVCATRTHSMDSCGCSGQLMWSSRANQPLPAGCVLWSGRLELAAGDHDHRRLGLVTRVGWSALDLLHHVHSVNHLAKHCVVCEPQQRVGASDRTSSHGSVPVTHDALLSRCGCFA